MECSTTVEQLKEKHDKEMQELITVQRIESNLPLRPKRILFAMKQQPWIIYSKATLAEAVALAEMFKTDWQGYAYASEEGGCTHIQPDSHLPTKHRDWRTYLELEGAPYLDLQTIAECPPSASLVFYPKVVTGQIARVVIDIERAPARIVVNVVHEGSTRWGSGVTKKDYPSLHEDKIVKWGDESDPSGRASYLWMTVDSYNAAMDSLLPCATGGALPEKV